MSTTNQVSSNSPPVSSQNNLNTTTTSNQASSGASFALGQTAPTISSGATGTGNSAAPASGNNSQIGFSNLQVSLGPTIASNQTGSNVSMALGQTAATINSGTTGTSNTTAPTTGVGNRHVSFHIGHPGVRYTPAAASAHRNRSHTEIDYRCGICTGDIVANEKAAVCKSSPYILLRLFN